MRLATGRKPLELKEATGPSGYMTIMRSGIKLNYFVVAGPKCKRPRGTVVIISSLKGGRITILPDQMQGFRDRLDRVVGARKDPSVHLKAEGSWRYRNQQWIVHGDGISGSAHFTPQQLREICRLLGELSIDYLGLREVSEAQIAIH